MLGEKHEKQQVSSELVSKGALDLLIMRDMVGDILTNAKRMNLANVQEQAIALDFAIAYALAASGKDL